MRFIILPQHILFKMKMMSRLSVTDNLKMLRTKMFVMRFSTIAELLQTEKETTRKPQNSLEMRLKLTEQKLTQKSILNFLL